MIMVIIGIVLLVVMLIAFLYVRPHLWYRGNSAAVSIEGVESMNSEIYHSPNGEILLRYAKPQSYEDYIVRRESKELGLAGSGFIPLMVCVYSKELIPPVVLSTNRVKIERDISVDFQRDWVEFTTSDAKRLRLEFRRLKD